jgi:arsenical resistance protein ArsH
MIKSNVDVEPDYINSVMTELFSPKKTSLAHKPKILILYGSLRDRSYSRLLAEEAAKILESFGAEVRFFHPHDLPLANIGLTQASDESILPDSVQALRADVVWCEAMVWSGNEVHGNISSVLKNQIDWLPLKSGAIRSTQGKLLAIMQVSGGSQSFNVLNTLRSLGRWMRLITIPNQSSVARAYQEFNEDGSMKLSSYRDRVYDVMEELFKFTLLIRGNADFLTQRKSEEA